jgi:hypothetical protein
MQGLFKYLSFCTIWNGDHRPEYFHERLPITGCRWMQNQLQLSASKPGKGDYFCQGSSQAIQESAKVDKSLYILNITYKSDIALRRPLTMIENSTLNVVPCDMKRLDLEHASIRVSLGSDCPLCHSSSHTSRSRKSRWAASVNISSSASAWLKRWYCSEVRYS